MTIGENLKKLKGDISTYRLAKESGISLSCIYEIINGKRNNPSIWVVKRLADCLKVDINEFLV